jgi:hypothetical protein
MKKIILPVLAFFFAIVASVASVNANDETLVFKRISLPAPSACSLILTHHCELTGSATCNNGSVDVREFNTATGTCGNTFTGVYEEIEN